MTLGRLIKKIFSLTISALAVLIISGFLSLHPINEQPNSPQNLEGSVQAVNNTESSLVKDGNSPLKSIYGIIKMYLKDLF